MTAPTPVSVDAVRVRFAPSPTGYLHVGGARTIFYNWLFAKHTGGKLILRIEDTDQARSTREHERMQIEDIHWLGLDYDEGPDIGGPYTPYRQSERLEIYAKYANELLADERAYYCFCSDKELTQKRETALKLGRVPQYDGKCRNIAPETAKQQIRSGEKASVRFKAPIRDYQLQDAVRGSVLFQSNMVGDFIVLRNDGMPVYNFCCVVDDYLMKISHVLRAEEHLSNTVRQMMLYETFGWKLPVFAHCSLILGPDRSKLSKRHGAVSVHQYAEEGYLPEALLNFLALLGWSHPDQKEILTRSEMIEGFALDRLHKAPCVFDPVKLKWMNGEYIRSKPVSEITSLTRPYLEKAGFSIQTITQTWLEQAVDSIRGHLQTLSQITEYIRFYFDDSVILEGDARIFSKETIFQPVVNAFNGLLTNHLKNSGDKISADEFLKIQDQIKQATGAKGKSLFMPLRIVVTGQVHGPELKIVIPLLGADRVLIRIENVLKQLRND